MLFRSLPVEAHAVHVILGVDYVFHEKASQVFDSRTSIFMGANSTVQPSGSGSQPLRMDTTKTVRRKGLASAGAGI